MIKQIDMTDWDRTVWCGPGVLAVLTGIPIKQATETFAKMQNTTAEQVSGTYTEEMIQALHRHGYGIRDIDLKNRYGSPVTVKRYLRERPAMEKVQPVLMVVDGRRFTHFCSAHFDYFCDNWTKRPVPIADMPKPNRLIFHAMQVMKIPT